MTGLQQQFLMYTILFFMVKGVFFVALYVALLIVEKKAKERQAQFRTFMAAKRRNENEKWSLAYKVYNKKQIETAAY